MIVLRQYSPFPPGEFVYDQPLPAGGVQRFPGNGLSIDQQSRKVLAFRVGNQLPGANLQQVTVDISMFTCQRLGAMNQWCYDTDAPPPVQIGNTGGCSTCGKRV